ncbi:MAG: NUDIX domain-containing protein [Anaerolineales bacterium]|nr:MAG: NUDIX domain-containing protein [Anaerolineales bacterium]
MPRSDQGVTRERYMLIPRVLIFLRRGESVLLIKGAPNKRLWANKYNGIGGHVERGEDVLAAARRELDEETGLRADLWLAGTVTVDASPDIGVGLYVFTGQIEESGRTDPLGRTYVSTPPNVSAQLRPSTEGTLEWLPLSELASRPLVEDVAALLDRVLRMKAGDPPFAARSFYDDDEKLKVVFA